MQHVIVLPDLGQTTNEAKVLTWHKKPGDKVSKGEALVEVETDKVDMDIESFVGGYLREILAPEGSLATALAPVAILTDRLDEPYTQPAAGNRLSQQAEEAPEPQAETALGPSPAAIAAVPAARMLAKKLGIDLSAVKGTGFGGLIRRHDVGGAAWAGENQVQQVELSTNGGKSCEPTQLIKQEDSAIEQAYSWVFWKYDWRIPGAGDYELVVRARNSQGRMQPAQRPKERLDPYELNGYQRVRCIVRWSESV